MRTAILVIAVICIIDYHGFASENASQGTDIISGGPSEDYFSGEIYGGLGIIRLPFQNIMKDSIVMVDNKAAKMTISFPLIPFSFKANEKESPLFLTSCEGLVFLPIFLLALSHPSPEESDAISNLVRIIWPLINSQLNYYPFWRVDLSLLVHHQLNVYCLKKYHGVVENIGVGVEIPVSRTISLTISDYFVINTIESNHPNYKIAFGISIYHNRRCAKYETIDFIERRTRRIKWDHWK